MHATVLECKVLVFNTVGVGVYDKLAACGVVVVVVGGGRAHAHLWYESSPNVGMQ